MPRGLQSRKKKRAGGARRTETLCGARRQINAPNGIGCGILPNQLKF